MAKVFQLNLHHATDATGITVGRHPDSVYLVQDAYFPPGQGKPGVRRKAHYHGTNRGRAGIYLSALQSCTFVPMHQFTENDIATGSLEGGSLKEPVVIASVYLDIHFNSPTILPKLRELVEHCYNNGKRLICGIDCNSHSSLWGSPDVNKRGEAIEEFIFEYGLYVENTGQTHTFQRGDSKTIIDITLSLNMGEDIQNWKVLLEEPSFSDHKLISYLVEKPPEGKYLTRNYAKADWVKFSSLVETHLVEPPQQWSKQIIENSVKNLNKAIDNGFDIACPKYPTKKRDKLDWWNSECEDAKSKYVTLERKMLRSPSGPTEESRMGVKVARRTFKKAIRRAKVDSFRTLVMETDSISLMSKLNKILDRRESSALGMVRNGDGTMSTTTQETLTVMLEEHFPGCIQLGPADDVPEEHHLDDHLDDTEDLEDPEAGCLRPLHSLDWIDNYRIKKSN